MSALSALEWVLVVLCLCRQHANLAQAVILVTRHCLAPVVDEIGITASKMIWGLQKSRLRSLFVLVLNLDFRLTLLVGVLAFGETVQTLHLSVNTLFFKQSEDTCFVEIVFF